MQYLTVYAVILVLSTLATIVRSLWSVAGGARCANIMFKHMTARVLRAPMSYFETTPLGRVLNRFTHDVEVLDIELSVSMTGLMISFSWLVSSVVVMVRALMVLLLLLVPRLLHSACRPFNLFISGGSSAMDPFGHNAGICRLFQHPTLLPNERSGSSTPGCHVEKSDTSQPCRR